MPAKAKVTKEMIVDAAFAVAREVGVESINARTVSERLHCSTQPVMYHFATIEELKRTVYAKADLYHSEYLMNMKKTPKGAALGIGMNYIRFAIQEPHLFRFLFQSVSQGWDCRLLWEDGYRNSCAVCLRHSKRTTLQLPSRHSIGSHRSHP